MLRSPSAFRFHQVGEDIVNARQVTLAFRFEPSKDFRVEADAYGYFPPEVAQPHEMGKLLAGQARDVAEINIRVVPRRLGARERGAAPFSPSQSISCS